MTEASPSSTPSLSLFDKLPLELLKLIVGLVREQDLAFRDHQTESTGFPCYETDSNDSDAGYDDEEEYAANGRWNKWYNSGIQALSLCNKQSRQLALPHLFRTVSSSRLAQPFFRIGISGGPLCQFVEHINLDKNTCECEFAAAAALREFPTLHAITLCGSGLPRFITNPQEDFDHLWRYEEDYTLVGKKRDEANMRKMARKTLLALSPRFSRINVTHATGHTLTLVLDNFASPTTLRHLHVTSDHLFAHPNSALQDALQQFSLVTLELCVIAEYGSRWIDIDEFWMTAIQMASLKSLVLTLAQLPVSSLRFVQALAPNLSSLQLRSGSIQMFLGADPLPLVVLSSLQHLHIVGPAVSAALISAFASCPVTRIDIEFGDRSGKDGHPQSRLHLPSVFPSSLTFPRTLRHLHVMSTALNPPSGVDVLSARLATFGVHLSVAWQPTSELDLFLLEPPIFDNRGAATVTVVNKTGGQHKEACESTLDWLKRRVDWLHATKDESAMSELLDIMRWARQRQVIESL
ncbi:hypothetical protein JCM10207_006461 [Rhodosporidiobolus poonsookiae]